MTQHTYTCWTCDCPRASRAALRFHRLVKHTDMQLLDAEDVEAYRLAWAKLGADRQADAEVIDGGVAAERQPIARQPASLICNA